MTSTLTRDDTRAIAQVLYAEADARPRGGGGS